VTKFYFAFPKRGIQSYRPAGKIDCVVIYDFKKAMTAYKMCDSKVPYIFIKLHKLQLLSIKFGEGAFVKKYYYFRNENDFSRRQAINTPVQRSHISGYHKTVKYKT
jgi:hypothetical protein